MATATSIEIDVADTPNPEPDFLYEVVDGRVEEIPHMGVFETDVASILVESLGPFATTHQLGRVRMEMLYLLDRDRNLKRRPDLSFVSRERWPMDRRVPRTAAWDVVPDLAVEVVSPSNTATKILTKLVEYFRAGVRLAWVVYPDPGQVYVYDSPTSVRILAAGDDLDGGAVIPGFHLPVAALFEDDPAPAGAQA